LNDIIENKIHLLIYEKSFTILNTEKIFFIYFFHFNYFLIRKTEILNKLFKLFIYSNYSLFRRIILKVISTMLLIDSHKFNLPLKGMNINLN